MNLKLEAWPILLPGMPVSDNAELEQPGPAQRNRSPELAELP